MPTLYRTTSDGLMVREGESKISRKAATVADLHNSVSANTPKSTRSACTLPSTNSCVQGDSSILHLASPGSMDTLPLQHGEGNICAAATRARPQRERGRTGRRSRLTGGSGPIYKRTHPDRRQRWESGRRMAWSWMPNSLNIRPQRIASSGNGSTRTLLPIGKMGCATY